MISFIDMRNDVFAYTLIVIFALTVGYSVANGDLHGGLSPNTIVTFCEWTTGAEFSDCTEDRYWHDNDYNVIYEEHVTYQKLVSDL